MRLVVTMMLLLLPRHVGAQAPPPSPTPTEDEPLTAAGQPSTRPQAVPHVDSPWQGLPDGSSEWSILAAGGRTTVDGGATGVDTARATRLFQSAFQWSRVLTAPHGFTPLRGQLQMGFELVPFLRAYENGESFGFSASPLFIRWRFVGTRFVQPYIEGLAGITRTDHPIPDGTTRFNFASQAGAGLRLAMNNALGLLVGYRFEHLSNASRFPINPGLNFHVVYVGLSWTRHRGTATSPPKGG